MTDMPVDLRPKYEGTLYAYVTDGEGIVATVLPYLGTTPLVFADIRNIERLRPLVTELAKASNKIIRIVKLVEVATLETITP